MFIVIHGKYIKFKKRSHIHILFSLVLLLFTILQLITLGILTDVLILPHKYNILISKSTPAKPESK